MMRFSAHINKNYKRGINTQELQDLMNKILNNKSFKSNKSSISDHEFLDKIQKLKEKVVINKDTIKFNKIEDNLRESRNIIKSLREDFSKIKEKSGKIDIQVKQEEIQLQDNKLDTLNKGLKNVRDIKMDDNVLIENTKEVVNNIDIYKKTILNTKKSIFNIEWLQPFFDFYNNHSTLVLTVGSGLIIGGMWYMNNIGIINIGSLLRRLGLNLLNNVNRSEIAVTPPITIINQQPSMLIPDNNRIANGFFRELGKKVLDLLDVFIDRLKENKQKYK